MSTNKQKVLTIASAVYIFMMVVGVSIFLASSSSLFAVIAGIVLAIAPVPVYLTVVSLLDKRNPEPKWLLTIAFTWGATVAAILSYIINSIVASKFGLNISAIVSAPLSEEIFKSIILFAFLFWKRDELDGLLDCVMYAIFVGLGFAMTENMLYYVAGINNEGLPHGLSIFWIRGIMTPLLHPFFTSMTAIGIGLSMTNQNEWIRSKAPFIGLFLAVVFHSVWNASGSLGNYSTEMVYYFVCLPMMFFMAYLLYTNSEGEKL